MGKLSNAKNHFKTITKHRHIVCGLCFKLGLYWQGMTHDLSKYQPIEFMTGVNYFAGTRSPNAMEKKDKGYSKAWLHHKGINKHHFEYWIDLHYRSTGLSGAKMPLKYLCEMVCDRIAASKVYRGSEYTDKDPLGYYDMTASAVEPVLHPDTKVMLKKILTICAEEGEDAAIEYMKWLRKNPEEY